MPERSDPFPKRYSTALLADAAYRCGVPVGLAPSAVNPLDPAARMAGPVRTVAANNDLVSILATVHRAAPGEVVVITNRTDEVGLLGDLIATEARRKGLGGFVVDGLVRDTSVLLQLGVPVFCRGRIPVGPLKLPAALKGRGVIDGEVTLGEAVVRPGMWAFGDADGVMILAAGDLDAVYARAEESLNREQGLLDAMHAGQALGDVLGIEAFLQEREHNDAADFNAHLARLGRAI